MAVPGVIYDTAVKFVLLSCALLCSGSSDNKQSQKVGSTEIQVAYVIYR